MLEFGFLFGSVLQRQTLNINPELPSFLHSCLRGDEGLIEYPSAQSAALRCFFTDVVRDAQYTESVILSFKNKTTAALFSGLVVKGLPPSIAQRAFDKLRLLDGAVSVEDLRIPPFNRWENFPAIAKANGASESTINGAFVFALRRVTRTMLKSLITIETQVGA